MRNESSTDLEEKLMPLTDEQKRDRIARRISLELRDGYYVNLRYWHADSGGELCAGRH